MTSLAAQGRIFAANAARLVRDRRPPFVLCYHGIGVAAPGSDPHGLLITPDAFAAHLDALDDAGYRLVTVGELWPRVAASGPRAARGLGVITFDDGLEETLGAALEIARRRDAILTAFVPSGLLGSRHPDLPDKRIADERRLRELADAGIEIGGHSATHVDLVAAGPDHAADEVRRDRDTLQEILDRPVAGMAYPYGRYDAQTIAATRDAGYAYACACTGAGPWRAYEVPREPVFPATSITRLRVKVAGLHGPVHALRRSRPAPASAPTGTC
jgi:peptidoglycan/xylan/chitin deacetylase (PgdA/CDA1 family)